MPDAEQIGELDKPTNSLGAFFNEVDHASHG